MTNKEREKLGIQSLPSTLEEAIQITEQSKLVRDTLGEHIFEMLLANKHVEWDQYRIHVSEYEVNNYLPML